MKLKKYKQKDPGKIGVTIFTMICILLITGVFFYTSFAYLKILMQMEQRIITAEV